DLFASGGRRIVRPASASRDTEFDGKNGRRAMTRRTPVHLLFGLTLVLSCLSNLATGQDATGEAKQPAKTPEPKPYSRVEGDESEGNGETVSSGKIQKWDWQTNKAVPSRDARQEEVQKGTDQQFPSPGRSFIQAGGWYRGPKEETAQVAFAQAQDL